MKISTSFALTAAIVTPVTAFVPSTGSQRAGFALSAERRNALGDIVKICGVASMLSFGAYQLETSQKFELVAGLNNPALETFKNKGKGQSYIPGRGMRNNENLS